MVNCLGAASKTEVFSVSCLQHGIEVSLSIAPHTKDGASQKFHQDTA